VYPPVLTIREAAAVAGVGEETVRRWVRAGRLPARRDGPRLLVAPEDVSRIAPADSLPLPPEWQATATGDPQPDWVELVRRSRARRR
jgi:excisionase family DNA binding protein